MSPAHVFEPTYAELKRRIVCGILPPGARLEANRLASDLGVSMTPVRDCLNRLVGERLVEIEYGHGFCAARLSEQDLRDLLSLNLMLLLGACTVRPSSRTFNCDGEDDGAVATRTARFFEALATASGNSELVDTIRWLNDRLNPARLCDKDVLAGTGRELDALWASAGRTPNDLPERLVAFHDRRQDLAARTIRRLEGKPI